MPRSTSRCSTLRRQNRSCVGPHRGGLSTRQRYRRHELRLDQVDPAAWARSRLRQRRAAASTTHPSPQHPRQWLLPLRKGETDDANTSNLEPPRHAGTSQKPEETGRPIPLECYRVWAECARHKSACLLNPTFDAEIRPALTHQPVNSPTITRPLASTVLPDASKHKRKNGNAAKSLT